MTTLNFKTQSVQRNKLLKSNVPNSQTTVCPECEKRMMELVGGHYTLSDGTFFDDLERWQCYSCQTTLFDVPAAKQIVESKKGSSIQSCIKPANFTWTTLSL